MNPNDIYLNSMYKINDNIYSEYNLNNFINKQETNLKDSKEIYRKFTSNINEIIDNIDNDILELNSLLQDSLTNLKKAIVGERTTSGYTYTTNIPLTTEYTSNNNTGIIENNILLGTSGKETYTVYEDISPTKLISSTIGVSHNNINLKDVSVTIQGRYKDLVLDLSGEKNGALKISFNTHNIVEVLLDDVLIVEKSLKKELLLPVGQVVRLRVHKSIERYQTIKINSIGIVTQLYTDTILYESSIISINKELEYLCFDICDNNDNVQVSIDYSIKINDLPYERISNNSNHKFTDLIQNIISTNKTKLLSTKEIKGTKRYEDDFRFYLPENSELNRLNTEVFVLNNLNVTNTMLYLVIEEDVELATQAILLDSPGSTLFINEKRVESSSIKLYKGIHSIAVIDPDTSEYTAINLYYLKNLIKTIFISKLVKTIREDEKGKYVSLTAKELSYSYDLISTKEFTLNIKNNSQSLVVETIQLKGELTSLDKTTCPYISKIVIRGV